MRRAFSLFAGMFAILTMGVSAEAYPEFIGYGYKSCLTCHWNGHGSGAINDYGRGVWATEIASRVFSSSKTTLEETSASAGFLGSVELPYWIRPSVKYRSLQQGTGVGSSRQRFTYIPMQLDLGLALSIDQDYRYMLIYTSGFEVDAKTREEKSMNRFRPREYYFRLLFGDSFWVYLGKMDIIYGVRNIDHTAANRKPLALLEPRGPQYAQSASLALHYTSESWELATQVFGGNPQTLSPEDEQKGGTLLFEFDPLENTRVGISGLSSKNQKNVLINLVGLHWKQGLSKGSSIWFETGMKMKKNLDAAPTDASRFQNGSYAVAQTMVKLSKGLHLLTNIERDNQDVAPDSPENWRVGMGMLYFPAHRFELRTHVYKQRAVSSTAAQADTWIVQGQLHVAL